ncbi:MAG: NYN domain-containing protein [Clostridiales bacterium]|nr:NYN domain-containing protein [Clostridiales bacterium]
MEEDREQRLAVLIDADNVSHTYIKPMLEEIARYGTPTIKRIYGDWTKPESSGWKNILLENAIVPVQQYRYTTGKNATDSTLIIDAMDILYGERVSGFCIVSSDSDFTRLATRLREAGMMVIGIGEQKTPQPFIVACDRFIFLEIIAPKNEKQQKDQIEPKSGSQPQNQHRQNGRVPQEVIDLILASVNDVADDDGWAFLGDVGNLLLKKQPSFDSRNYGYSKLTPLISSTGLFEIDKRDTSNRGIKHIYIRDRGFTQGDKP